MNKVIASSVIAGLFLSALPTASPLQTKTAQAASTCKVSAQPKNVIFMIGDGMGPSYTSAYRYMQDKPQTNGLDTVSFDNYLLGAQRTIAEDDHQNITDSASAATAMSSGVKTYNNAIAVDNDKTPVKTVLEQAKTVGKSTGLVATSEVTHATPAAYGAHDESRKNMPAIADDYYDEMINGKHKVDVILGGGKDYFKREDRNLIKEFKNDGYKFVDNKKGLLKAASNSKDKQILGLFSPGGMPKMIDRDANMPSLQDMTKTAIKKLNANKKGFFLMVEGSQIDWAGHANDVTGAMSEMRDFDLAFQEAINFAKTDCNTLVIATADHSTGGLSMGARGEYNFFVEPIRQMKHTSEYLRAQLMKDGADVDKIIKDNIGFQLTAAELQAIKDAVAAKNATAIEDAIERPVDTRSYTGWTTGGHTGEDVNVYGYGPGSTLWRGNMDNTDNAKRIFKFLK
ncbi:alkaline phosphatase [Macrococcus equipercicus]|uniref:Alkaline phosphatase n=1 Tax=Macrococcus equipercicus TaxID=69967 RepID=A0ABQ6RC19_9STAP|nr:alkaline phosphatase [Macrococcus equipercicus]